MRSAMKSDYTEVKTNWAFGDILVLLEDGKEAKHMCVYVADDEAAVREHAECGGFPANVVSRVTSIIDPITGE